MPVPLEAWEQLSMEQWTCIPCDAVNLGIRKVCRFCKQTRPEIAALSAPDAIAMEARQGGDRETGLHPKDDSAGPQDIAALTPTTEQGSTEPTNGEG